MSANVFLILNLTLSFYLIGAIWAVEVDIFRSWKLVSAKDFRMVQSAHWRKLPYWVFTPLALALAGSIALIWFHPAGSPAWAIWGNLACQFASHVLTAIYWGRWQASLSKDDRGPASPYLAKILSTHLDTDLSDQRLWANTSCLDCTHLRITESELDDRCRLIICDDSHIAVATRKKFLHSAEQSRDFDGPWK